MEDILEVYTRPHDESRPLVCLDETSKQLIGETRTPIPMKPGQPARYDYEYKRGGTQSLFMLHALGLDPIGAKIKILPAGIESDSSMAWLNHRF